MAVVIENIPFGQYSHYTVSMKILLIFILAITVLGCGKKNGASSTSATTTTPDFSKLSPTCYLPYSSSPIITSGDFASALSLPGTNWNDPHVLKVNDQYWMYASSDNGSFNFDIKIYRLLSSDGIHWTPNPTTPVLQKSASGQFDSEATETPAVVYFKNQYHLFWTGYTDHTDVKTWKIGHAVSNDGINFVKDAAAVVAPTDPNGAVNLDFNQYTVAEPAPTIFNNKIYLYFTAVGANLSVGTTLQVIGLTTSSDGTTWSTPVSTLLPDQTLYPRGAPQYYKGYSTPHAIAMNNEVHLYVDVATTDATGTPFVQKKFHHAKSSDGITNWVQDSTAIYDRSQFSWTSAGEINAPALLLDGNVLKFWFAGNNGVTLGIGYSTCQL